MNYNRLETSLIDVIKEEQAKLGYMKEKISLYYPLSSLNHFFGNETDAAGMMEILKDFPSYIEEKFGEVAVSHRGDRFCFTVSEKASEYVQVADLFGIQVAGGFNGAQGAGACGTHIIKQRIFGGADLSKRHIPKYVVRKRKQQHGFCGDGKRFFLPLL